MSKTKIPIKSYLGEVLFEHEAEENSIKKAVEAAVKDRAYLVRASLDGASLDRASLVGANLDGASLVRANLAGANLAPIKHDLWAVLSSAPVEVEGLRKAILNGKIDGSSYEGECACLVGTIANVRGKNYKFLGCLKPDSFRPAERFFLAIKTGDTPETSQFSKLALEWIDEWLANVKGAFSKI